VRGAGGDGHDRGGASGGVLVRRGVGVRLLEPVHPRGRAGRSAHRRSRGLGARRRRGRGVHRAAVAAAAQRGRGHYRGGRGVRGAADHAGAARRAAGARRGAGRGGGRSAAVPSRGDGARSARGRCVGRRARDGRGGAAMSLLWIAVIAASVLSFVQKWSGYQAPQGVLERPRIARITRLLPIALLGALVATQTAADGTEVVLDARLAGLGVAVVLLLVRAPFLVVVVGAAA